MIPKMLLWLFAVGSYFGSFTLADDLNMTLYFSMPKLYDFDDYDRCLQEFRNQSTYCFVRANIVPKEGSEIWYKIATISDDVVHHFDHRHLYYGLCVHRCEDALKDLPSDEINQLYIGLLTNNSKVNAYTSLFSAEEENRQRYNRLLNQCINLRLRKSHDLMATSMIEYCDLSDRIIENDAWNYTVYGVTIVLISLAVCSSIYDWALKRKHDKKMSITDREYYKTSPQLLHDKICVMFSVTRNWYRLNQPPTGTIGRELRFLDCFKFFCMVFVIYAHTIWLMYEGMVSNPQDAEQSVHSASGTFTISGAMITVTFFVISGFLLTVNWLAVTKVKSKLKAKDYLALYLVFNLVRYIRLTLPMIFMILVSGYFTGNEGGPLWRHIVEREQLACRETWWTNLLYISDYMDLNGRCMVQTWYLAADTHCFLLCLLILMVIYKWPKIRTYVLIGSYILSHAVPGIIVYVKQYFPIYIASPQVQRDGFTKDDEFKFFYAPFYMNFGCYFCGVLAGLVYDYLSRTQFKLRQFKTFHFLWYALVPAAFLWIFSAHPLLQYNYADPPRFWGSVYASMHRNSWSFGLAVFIVGMASRVGWIFYKFACLPIFKILGRLTYGTFIVHLLVVRMVVATQRDALYYSYGTVFTFVLYGLVVSYLCSFMLAILIELPVSAALKLLRPNK